MSESLPRDPAQSRPRRKQPVSRPAFPACRPPPFIVCVYFPSSANAVMLSSVTGLPKNPPPVDAITTYCLPSFPWYVIGVASAAPPSLKVHSSLPFLASNARKRPSSVAATNTSPPAVAIVPPFPGRPVLCLSAGKLSVTPSGTRHTNSPVLTLTAVNCPHGGCWHGSCCESLPGTLNRPPPGKP